jgi:cell fate (sporulation/competence/biofilm development) regulator YmcA (YheA/YmcA/DUF963 family)
MVDKEVVINRIKHLEDNINYLEKINDFDQNLETLESNRDIFRIFINIFLFLQENHF